MSSCESKGLVVCSATMLKYEFYLSFPTTLTQMLMNLWIQQDFRQVFFCLQKPIVISTRLTGREMKMWINQKTLLPTEMLLKFYAKYSWDLIRRSVISLLWTMLMEQGSEWTSRISFSQIHSLGANTRGGMTGCFMEASDLCLIVLTVYPKKYAHGFSFVLCFVVVIHWLIFPYPSGLLHWHCGNLTIAPVPAKQHWWIWINTSCEFIMNDYITTTKQSTTKLCAYFLGYTVAPSR